MRGGRVHGGGGDREIGNKQTKMVYNIHVLRTVASETGEEQSDGRKCCFIERSQEVTLKLVKWGTVFQAKGTASGKAQRPEHGWHV